MAAVAGDGGAGGVVDGGVTEAAHLSSPPPEEAEWWPHVVHLRVYQIESKRTNIISLPNQIETKRGRDHVLHLLGLPASGCGSRGGSEPARDGG